MHQIAPYGGSAIKSLTDAECPWGMGGSNAVPSNTTFEEGGSYAMP